MNKAKYINAEAVKLKVAVETAENKVLRNDSGFHAFLDGFRTLFNKVIDEMQAADVQEVIRCENCRYSVPLDKNCELSQCYLHCTEWHGEETKNVWHKYKKYYKDYSIVERDDFCSFGARMDGDLND